MQTLATETEENQLFATNLEACFSNELITLNYYLKLF